MENDSKPWSVDRLAADNLAVNLGVKFGDGDLSLIAEHFARHRLEAYEWAAERVRSSLIAKLESASHELFQQRRAEWIDGFIFAEQLLLAIEPNELTGIPAGQARTKGQVLRTMVRRAKHASS